MRRLAWLLLAMMPMAFSAWAAPLSSIPPDATLQGADSSRELGPHIAYLHDIGGRMDLAAVQASSAANDFQP